MKFRKYLLPGIVTAFTLFGVTGISQDTTIFLQDSVEMAPDEQAVNDSIAGIGESTRVPEEAEVSGGGMEHTTADALSVTTETASETTVSYHNNVPFYAHWWFSLLIILLVLPFLFRIIMRRKDKEFIRKATQFEEQLKMLNTQLSEKENQFETFKKEHVEDNSGEMELRYQSEGISKFSEILSRNKNDMAVLGQKLISEIVHYLNANSGAIYIAKNENETDVRLEFLGGFAPSPEQIKGSFKAGEGYVGTCYAEGRTMELTNTPDTYIKVISGLGESKPQYIVFVPLIQDELKLGVIELASFNKLEEYKVQFVEKLSENIASTLAISHANEKMSLMLEQSRAQADELRSQEEEMRQNLEEMHATQEDLHRQMSENKKIQENLIREKAQLDSIMNNLPDSIYFKDLESKFIRISKSMLQFYPVDSIDDIVGKSDFYFQSKENAQKYYDEEQSIIKTGKGFIDHIEHEVMSNGVEQWVSTSKMPLFDETGKCIGTFGITKNITGLKKLEMEARNKADVLLEQEEKLRQNIEEMQATQDELNRQKSELDKEKALMDALLTNVNESIYFKDLESRFIKASTSMTKLFDLKHVEDLYGKSDFDFFTEEHARPAFEDEMKIIKTGRAIVDKIETETHADGRISYVSTTKKPLKDIHGHTIGTFGISKDITHIKQIEIQMKEKNEELQAQEEELRQNLEEMQSTQEELVRQNEENKRMQEELAKEKYLMDTMMTNIREHIYFKDTESRFIKVSESMTKLFNVKKVGEIYGKSDFDFFDEKHAKPALEDEQKIIRTGKAIVDKIEKEVKKDGTISWVSTTKMPLKDQNGKIVGTFGISKDITESMTLEMEIKQKNEELLAQEEELRQNLEEMMTTQDELVRQNTENKKIQEELAKEKYLMDTLMTNIHETIYFKDAESKFIKVSDSLRKLFNVKKAEEIYGKTDFDFFDREHAQPAFEDEQKIIRTGQAVVDQIEKEVKKDGTVAWVSTTKMPIKDQNGKIVGTFGISKDITESMTLEMEIKQKNEELQAQEEELRQNLEEMMTTQEELAKQIEQNKKAQVELTREKNLLDALLNNVPEHIYFKDKESRFIRNSLSLSQLFGFNDVNAITGKSDFDFFGEEHAMPAFKDEQKIIKTGKPILDLVEKEVKKDGSVSWVSTTKMPLKDNEGEIIGTFGISKDITERVQMEIEIKQKNEELLAQEEELRQNLEEMQTIQDDMNKRLEEKLILQKEFEKKEKQLKLEIKKLEGQIKSLKKK